LLKGCYHQVQTTATFTPAITQPQTTVFNIYPFRVIPIGED